MFPNPNIIIRYLWYNVSGNSNTISIIYPKFYRFFTCLFKEIDNVRVIFKLDYLIILIGQNMNLFPSVLRLDLIDMSASHSSVLRVGEGWEKRKERERERIRENSFSCYRDLATYSRENIRVTRTAYRGIVLTVRLEIEGLDSRSDKRACIFPRANIEIARAPPKISSFFAVETFREMTRTNATANGGGVAAPAKRSLVRVGNYQMLKPLGKGNFARVEEAIHTVLGVKVSVINSNRRERGEPCITSMQQQQQRARVTSSVPPSPTPLESSERYTRDARERRKLSRGSPT